MTLVLFIFVNLVFFCQKMILRIKIEISRNDFYNSLGFYLHNEIEIYESRIENSVHRIDKSTLWWLSYCYKRLVFKIGF